MVQLEHCLQILRCTLRADVLFIFTYVRCNTDIVTSQLLLQLCYAEITQATAGEALIDSFQVSAGYVGIEGCAATAEGIHGNLVCLVLGLLEENGYAVRQDELLEIGADGIALNNVTGLGHLLDKR